jgi:hypothetical protein
MSDKAYTLKINGEMVAMSMRDFSHLAGELTGYGVDVEIQASVAPDEICFQLKESTPEQ